LHTVGSASLAALIPAINKYVTEAGGKRLRPILTMICGELIGCPNHITNILAAVVELIHTATLLHDDVIDETMQRRGVKTANNIWNNKACILVGDYQFSQAFKLMLKTECLGVLNLLAEASSKMAEGEVWQLDLIGKLENSLATYIKLIEAKTATLFIASCKSVAVYNEAFNIGNINAEMINALENYGKTLGILFQIVDDMLDYFSQDGRFGKNTGTDLRERKVTMPVILAYNTANQNDKAILQKIFSQPVSNDEEENSYFITVKDLLNKYDVSAQVHGVLQQYVEQGLHMLDILPKGKASEHLRNLLLSAPSRIY